VILGESMTLKNKPFATTGFVSYNFGCMIASDMLFDSRGGFLGSTYLMET